MTTTDKPTPQSRSPRFKGVLLLVLALLAVFLLLEGDGQRALFPSKNSLRSEEHTSELQSQSNLVCRLLLEKKKNKQQIYSALKEVNGRQVPHKMVMNYVGNVSIFSTM